MDVELQILKDLRRDAHPTVEVIDECCEEYREIFKEVRNYECFKYLHLGIISTIKRKSLFYSQFLVVSRKSKEPKIRESQESIKWKSNYRSHG
ncbi:Mobile element protein [Umezakia ovalisporum]|jgi:SRSO17 transposase|nr:Mobile element protein [Umezakia ovalisporum]